MITVLAGVAIFGAVAISRPIRHIGEVLLELARGNRDVEVPYTERRDEVGDNARAGGETFKEKLIRIEQLEAAEKETERRSAEQRKADMRALADLFESAVADVVHAVSSSSTELEAAAEAIRTTAGSTRELSGKVLSASTQASENVRSVSFATEQLHRLGRRNRPASARIDPDRGRGRGASGEDRRAHHRTDRRSRPHRRRRES